MVTHKIKEDIWSEAIEIQCDVIAIHPIGVSTTSYWIMDFLKKIYLQSGRMGTETNTNGNGYLFTGLTSVFIADVGIIMYVPEELTKLYKCAYLGSVTSQ